jgi:hypothetical protein
MTLRFVSALGLAAAACVSASAFAKAPVAAAPAGPPKLIVAIAVDQFSADLFAQYRRHFTKGLARLQDGAVFPSAYQSHAATETCPGHSTILTGDHPARTGIIANTWFALGGSRADKAVYCAEDETQPGTTSRNYVVSANHLRVPTLGELITQASPQSRNVAVSGKDRAVVMMGGHAIDAGFWWKGNGFTSFVGRDVPPSVQMVNAAIAKALAKGAPAMPLPANCGPRDVAVPVGKGAVGAGRFALERDKPDQFRVSPRLDDAVSDIAIRLLDEQHLGSDAATDVLSVSYSATDYVGHAMGSEGAEMCIQMAALDQTIGRLLAALDARRLDYVVMLTADHGGVDVVERLDRQALPQAVRVVPALSPDGLAARIAQDTGVAVPAGQKLLYGDGAAGDFYVAAGLSPADKARVVVRLLALTRADPQVEAAFGAAEIAAIPVPSGNPQDWSMLQRARASYDAERSGDVVVLLRRGVSPIAQPGPGYVSTHGSPWDYDRRVPLLFWRKGMTGFEQPAPVETVDIAPTLAHLVGLQYAPGQFDGRCLDLDAGAGDTCGATP